MTQYYTYVYKDPLKNMEPFYVGKGNGKRLYRHLSRKDKHPLTQRLQKMLREGNKPDIEIINVTCENTAFRLEMFLINQYGRKDLGTGPLLNLTDGGEGGNGKCGLDHPMKKIENKEKLRIAQLGSNNSMYDRTPWNKGIPQSKEAKDINIKTHIGKSYALGCSHSEESKIKQHNSMIGRPQPKVTCPHCGKIGGSGAMHQWHFENCKNRG